MTDTFHARALRPSHEVAAHLNNASPAALIGPAVPHAPHGPNACVEAFQGHASEALTLRPTQVAQLDTEPAEGQHPQIWAQYLRLVQCMPRLSLDVRRHALEAAIALGDPAGIRTVLDHSARAGGQDRGRLLRDVLLDSEHIRRNPGRTLSLMVAALNLGRKVHKLPAPDIRAVMLSLAGTRDIHVLEQAFLFLAAQGCTHVPYYRALLGQMYANNGRAAAQALLNRWLTGAIDVAPSLRRGLSPHLLRQRVMVHIEEESRALEQVDHLI